MATYIQKSQELLTNLKTTAHKHAKELEKMNSNQRKKAVLIVVGFAAMNLAYSLFSIYTLLSFGLMMAGIAVYLKLNLDEIKKKGLISFLPPKLQKTLLQRSLFDVLCDIWFIPRISIYVKALVSPFILKLDPSEAIGQFKDFPPATKKAILTKGIINIMPGLVQSALLPQGELTCDESLDLSSVEQEQQELVNNDVKCLESNQEESMTNGLLNDIATADSLSLHKFESGVLQTSTDSDGFVNHNFALMKPMFNVSDISTKTIIDYQRRSKDTIRSSQVRGMKSRERKTGAKAPRVEKTYDSECDLRSEILSSNKMAMKKANSRSVEVSETWDKLELFTRMHRETLLKQKLNIGGAKKLEFKGPLQMIQNIVMLLSKDAIMKKLDDKKLFKVFVISSLALLLQFSISKKTRYWCYNTLNILMYISGFTLSTGSVAVLMFKLRTRYLEWKNQQRIEAAKEEKDTTGENNDDSLVFV